MKSALRAGLWTRRQKKTEKRLLSKYVIARKRLFLSRRGNPPKGFLSSKAVCSNDHVTVALAVQRPSIHHPKTQPYQKIRFQCKGFFGGRRYEISPQYSQIHSGCSDVVLGKPFSFGSLHVTFVYIHAPRRRNTTTVSFAWAPCG